MPSRELRKAGERRWKSNPDLAPALLSPVVEGSVAEGPRPPVDQTSKRCHPEGRASYGQKDLTGSVYYKLNLRGSLKESTILST
jgi:hypothetical protein